MAVPVTNTGERPGSEVVQCYVAPPLPARLTRPPKELAGFAKVWLEPGETATVRLTLNAPPSPTGTRARTTRPRSTPSCPRSRSRAAGAAGQRGWQVDAGEYRLLVGRSSADLPHTVTVQVNPSE